MEKKTVAIDLDTYKDMCIDRLHEFRSDSGNSSDEDDEEVIKTVCDLIAEYPPTFSTDPMYVVDNVLVNGDIHWSKEDFLDAYNLEDNEDAINKFVEENGITTVDLPSGETAYVVNWGL